MAVTSTLPITFTDLYNEFGGDVNNITLSDYLRGGGLVPDIPANSGVPTSLPVSLDDFLGATAFVPDIIVEFTGAGSNPPYYGDYGGSSTVVAMGVQYTTTGRVQLFYTTVGSTGSTGTWIEEVGGWAQGYPIDSSRGSEFQIRFAQYPDDYGSWMTLDSNRRLTYKNVLNGSAVVSAVEIREQANWNNFDRANYYVGLNY